MLISTFITSKSRTRNYFYTFDTSTEILSSGFCLDGFAHCKISPF